ncbi:RDD family protein [Nocardia sp. NPDC052278]|uniref:RDD family protein n=1 Tax=unclassified Nocardia TaxID=2637762 RepID=UPI00367B5C47
MTVELENHSSTTHSGDMEDTVIESAGTDKDERATEFAETRGRNELANASWRARVLAYAIDVICPAATLAAVCLIVLDDPQDIYAQIGSTVAAVAVAAFVLWNTGYRQGKTGRTIGKLVVGIRTIAAGTVAAPGITRTLLREVAHIVDTVPLLLGWLWPLWDEHGRSFADKLAETRVSADSAPSSSEARPRALRIACTIFVFFAAALVALTGTQYAHDYRSDRDTATIVASAPDIAQNATVALLSYQAATVDKDLASASSKLTGSFKDYYDKYTKDVVIPTAREKSVNTHAQSVGAAVVSADSSNAVVLVFVNQITTTAQDPQPSAMASTVRVQLTESDGHWLVSGFDPI